MRLHENVTTASAFQRRAPRVMTGTGAAIALGSALLLGASPAALADGGCATGSTLVSSGVCEVAFTSSGTFTPPATTTKVEALLVGAGGAGTGLYAGGGGDVQIVELLSTGEITVTVGAGGTYSSGGDGVGGASSVDQGSSTDAANGGTAGTSGGPSSGGDSGNGNEGSAESGGGAGGASPNYLEGGPGVVVSDLSSTLFTDVDDCFGGGGGGIYYDQTASTATCGGGYVENLVSNTGGFPHNANTGSADVYYAVDNSGGGAGAVVTFDTIAPWTTSDSDGADGYVALRYAATELPATGVDTSVAGISALLLASGAFVMALARRARRS